MTKMTKKNAFTTLRAFYADNSVDTPEVTNSILEILDKEIASLSKPKAPSAKQNANESVPIGIIKQLIKTEKIIWTNHVMVRLLQRNITQDDIEYALMNGEIIESYEDDYPYPSCLVFGINKNNEIIHMVCGSNGESLWIITAYYPNAKEWVDDMKQRQA